MRVLTSLFAAAALVSIPVALPEPASAKSDKDSSEIHEICELMVGYRIYANFGQCIAEFNNKGAIATCRHIQNTRGFGGLYKNFGECLAVVRSHE